MNAESSKFSFQDVVWKESSSREISLNPRPTMRTGVLAATVLCKSCGHVWQAGQHGPGCLSPAIGGILLSCPNCRADEALRLSAFE